VDIRFALPPDYVPPGLVPVGEAGFSGPFLVRRVVVEDLSALRKAVEAAGYPVEVAAAYRSYDQQASLFDRRVDQLGREGALRRVARPGHSEHQLGTALDFKRAGAADVTQGFGRSGAGRWLAENAWRFGFVLSYPRGESAVTCYAYEPWHFRYLGRGLAARVQVSGKTVRELLWELDRASRD
jgi:D-alanyl-D-alanine carboxypeptidase